MLTAGDTVRLTAMFKDFDCQTILTPADVKITIFDRDKNVILNPTVVTPVNNIYAYDYTLPNWFVDSDADDPALLFFEYKGTVDGKPALRRMAIGAGWCPS